MLGSWAFVSPVGGTGKSVLCANLGMSFALTGKKVLVIDLCPDAPALDMLYGVSENVVYTMEDVGKERVPVADALLSVPVPAEKKSVPGELYLLPVHAGTVMDSREYRRAVAVCIRESAPDVALIDTDRTLYPLLYDIADGAFLVTTPEEHAVRAAEAFAFRAKKEKLPLSAQLLTRLPFRKEEMRRAIPPRDLIDRVGLPLAGIFPEERETDGMLFVGVKKAEKRDFVAASANLVGRMGGEPIPLLDGIAPEDISRTAYLSRGGYAG